jgi:hypothetical protein
MKWENCFVVQSWLYYGKGYMMSSHCKIFCSKHSTGLHSACWVKWLSSGWYGTTFMFQYINGSVWCEIWGSHSGVSVDSSFLCRWASSSDISKTLWSFKKLVTIYQLTQRNVREGLNFMECAEVYFVNAWKPNIGGLKHSLFQQNFLSFILYSWQLFLIPD